MPKSAKRPSTPARRKSPGHPGRRAERRAAEDVPDIESDIRHALETGHPLPLLLLASSMLTALDPGVQDPFGPSDRPEVPPLTELVSAFASAGPATAALARAVVELNGDELLRARVVREAEVWADQLPDWVGRLGEVEPVAAQELTDVLRDSDDVLIHVRVADADVTAVCLVDFNLGTVVKDAFLRPVALIELTSVIEEGREPERGGLGFLALADARARVEEAVEVGAMTWPPLESDEWPASRPLLTWLLRRLPAGGAGYERPRWTEAKQRKLAQRFLASSDAPRPASLDDASIVNDLLWFGTDYGYGDPRRWSPAGVEILLRDWYPRKIVADQDYLLRLPVLLRAFVRFAHAEVGVAELLTLEAEAAIEALEDEYRATISKPRLPGRAALLGGLGLPDLELFGGVPERAGDPGALEAYLLADQVGGLEQLATVDDDPLPDEPFDWSGVQGDLHEPVGTVLRLVDRWAERFADTEHRTAVRRLLHDVAVTKPRAFRGSGSTATAAAAVCWLVARANDSAGARISTAELVEHFDLRDLPSGRVATMRQAVGAQDAMSPGSLGSARYLCAAARRELIRRRDTAGAG